MSICSLDALGSKNSRETFLKVSDVWKSFGNESVLKGLSFELKKKEILGVIGPSGGGKTTLLRCLNFLEDIDDGEIEYIGSIKVRCREGERAILSCRIQDHGAHLGSKTLTDFRRKVGFVFQGFNLWEERSVLDNLTLAPRVVLQKPRADAVSAARELCEQFALTDKLNAKGLELSGGQRQRVAIMRALMMEPEIMLLDEITSALDPVLTLSVMNAVRQLRHRGLTMIIVTHHIEFASSLCDKIMFLKDGKAMQIDTPERLKAVPATEEVRSFLGVLQSTR